MKLHKIVKNEWYLIEGFAGTPTRMMALDITKHGVMGFCFNPMFGEESAETSYVTEDMIHRHMTKAEKKLLPDTIKSESERLVSLGDWSLV